MRPRGTQNMNNEAAKALASDRVIDIITTGRQTGEPRRIEIWFHRVDGRYYTTGAPGRPRSWYANLVANSVFTFHLKESATADLPATAPGHRPRGARASTDRHPGFPPRVRQHPRSGARRLGSPQPSRRGDFRQLRPQSCCDRAPSLGPARPGPASLADRQFSDRGDDLLVVVSEVAPAWDDVPKRAGAQQVQVAADRDVGIADPIRTAHHAPPIASRANSVVRMHWLFGDDAPRTPKHGKFPAKQTSLERAA